jgi:ActR/RegA family two-component response regulator
MRRVFLIDTCGDYGAMLREALHDRGFDVHTEENRWKTVRALRQPTPEWEFVIIVVKMRPEEQLCKLRELVVASQQFHQTGLPEFIFASCVRCPPSLRIEIERLGARYVRL